MAGYYVLYRYRLAEVKKEMRRELLSGRAENMTKLVFDETAAQSLQWENTGEFQYEGGMYDVVKLEKTAGQLVVWCLSDQQETALLNDYVKAQKQSSESSPIHAIQKIISTQFLPSSIVFVLDPVQLTSKPSSNLAFILPAVDKLILTPPPQAC